MRDLLQCEDNRTMQDLIAILWGDARKVLSGGVDWPALVQTARVEGLIAMLYDILRKKWPTFPIPAEVWGQMEEHYRTTQVVNITMREKLELTLSLLAAADIPVIVLKGAALSELVYQNIGLRAMVDLDLLIKAEHAERASGVLKAAGFLNVKPELRPGFNRCFGMEDELKSPPPFETRVEIHWRLVGPLFACRYVDDAAVWLRATPVTIVGQPAYTLGAEDWVLHQVAHAFYKHRCINLLTLCDLDRLIRYLGDRLDWDKLLRIGEAFHWLPALGAVLPQLANITGYPVPQNVVEFALQNRQPAFEAWLLRWWLKPERPERYHIFPDWLTLPTMESRIYIIGAYLFPTDDYIRALYPGKPGWQLPFLYFLRFWYEMFKK